MLVGANMEDSWLVETIVVLNSKIDKISFVYLSLPIGGSLERLSFWHLLIPSIRKRRFGWKSKNLFMGGRLVLIKYVLHTRMIYFISFFKASIDIIYLIDSFLNLFLWHESEEIWTINLIHWNNIFFIWRLKDWWLVNLIWRCWENGVGDACWSRGYDTNCWFPKWVLG